MWKQEAGSVVEGAEGKMKLKYSPFSPDHLCPKLVHHPSVFDLPQI